MSYCAECSASVPDDATHCPTCGAILEVTAQAELEAPKPPELDLDRLQATLSASLSPTYEVLKPLGRGGMGAIFLAKEPALKRLVAVKVLAPQLAADNNSRVRFEREARAAAAISHPNVVRVFAVGETKRTKLPYIIMQYVEGPNLEEWRLRRGRLSEREARRIIGEVAAALAAAHERELVHRDVKPSNVLLETETGRAFVADFGVSAALSDAGDETRLTQTGVIVGTPTYMSPEQSANVPITPTSDVYSLGIVAYELLTGDLPFSANSPMGWAAAHLRDTPTPTAECRPEISPALAQIVDSCLAKSPEERPTSDEIARGLLPSPETEIEWPPPGLQWLLGRARFVNRLALVAAAGAGVATLAWTFVPEILIAGAEWLRRFEIAPDILAPSGQTQTGFSNTAVLAMFLWQVALTVGLVMYGAAGLAFLSSASRTAERVFRQRSLGWRISTLIDIAVDHDGRSGLVIAGTADFASFKHSRRRNVLWARRWATAAVAAGASWIIVAFALHTVLLVLGLTDSEATTTLLSTLDTVLILAPGGLLVSCGLGFRLWERQILGKLGRRHSFDAEPDDVSRWYESIRAEEVQPATSMSYLQHRIGVWSVRLARLGLFLIIPIVVFALALGTVATLTAGRFSERFSGGAAELLATQDQIDTEDPIGTSRAAWAPYLPPSASVPGSFATEGMRRLRLNLRDSEAIPAYGVALAEFFEWNSAERRTVTDEAFERALRNDIPPDTLELLGFLANHPRTMLFRRLAIAPDIDVLHRSSQEDSSTSAPLRSLAMTVTEAARANVLAAVFEASQGNVEFAVRRLGENAAIGEHLLRTPRVTANRLALRILRNQALYPLASLERARGNVDRAALLDRAAERAKLGQRFGNAAALAPIPEDFGEFVAAATNRRIPIGFRVSWLRQGWAGMCAHPREIILGPSIDRLDAMHEVVIAMSDVPRVRQDAEVFEASWRWPATTLTSGVPSSTAEVRLEDRLLLGAVFRVFSCVIPDNPI